MLILYFFLGMTMGLLGRKLNWPTWFSLMNSITAALLLNFVLIKLGLQ